MPIKAMTQHRRSSPSGKQWLLEVEAFSRSVARGLRQKDCITKAMTPYCGAWPSGKQLRSVAKISFDHANGQHRSIRPE